MDAKNFTSTIAKAADCEPSQAAELLKAFANILKEECGAERRVAIPGFGSFEGVKHEEEVITDLATGHQLLLPPSIEIRFTASGSLKKHIKENHGKEGQA